MSTRDVTPDDLERYRIALHGAIGRSSLRAVASAVGMSPTGLTKFLDGHRPYAKTVERVRDWYQRHAGLASVRADEIAAQLRRIVGTLPEPDNGVANLLAAVEASYRSAGISPPEWVERVRRMLGARPAEPRSGLSAAAILLAPDTA